MRPPPVTANLRLDALARPHSHVHLPYCADLQIKYSDYPRMVRRCYRLCAAYRAAATMPLEGGGSMVGDTIRITLTQGPEPGPWFDEWFAGIRKGEMPQAGLELS